MQPVFNSASYKSPHFNPHHQHLKNFFLQFLSVPLAAQIHNQIYNSINLFQFNTGSRTCRCLRIQEQIPKMLLFFVDQPPWSVNFGVPPVFFVILPVLVLIAASNGFNNCAEIFHHSLQIHFNYRLCRQRKMLSMKKKFKKLKSVPMSWNEDENLLQNVLTRLTGDELKSLKVVSRGWNDLICASFYANQQLKLCVKISGFFFKDTIGWMVTDDSRTITFVSCSDEIPMLRSGLLKFPGEPVMVLFSTCGILCCRNYLPSVPHKIFICNPTLQHVVSVGFLDSFPFLSNLGFVFHNHAMDGVFQFTLVRTVAENGGDCRFVFNVYCSVRREWIRFEAEYVCRYDRIKGRAVELHGIVYWLTYQNGVLMFDCQHDLAYLIAYPFSANLFTKFNPEMCIGKSGGYLHYFILSEHGLQVWVLKEPYEPLWKVESTASLFAINDVGPVIFCGLKRKLFKFTNTPFMEPLAFVNVVVVLRVSNLVYMYNIQMKTMTVFRRMHKRGSIYSTMMIPYTSSLVRLM